MVPCICYFELRFWCCFPCFCLLKTSCLLNYLREFPPPCSLITSCSLNYFERIFPPVRLLHPVLLIDSSEQQKSLKDRFCIQFFRPKTCPRTFLQCFALDSCFTKAKHRRDVLGRVLGRKNQIQNPSLREGMQKTEQKPVQGYTF